MTDKAAERRRQIAQGFVSAIPHAAALSMQIDAVREGQADMSMPYDPRLIGDPATGVIHGGPVSVLMDTCGAAAVLAHPRTGIGTATLDLRIDYMRPATPGQRIRARAECYHMTRSVAFVRAIALDDNEDHPVAAATGAFSVERAD